MKKDTLKKKLQRVMGENVMLTTISSELGKKLIETEEALSRSRNMVKILQSNFTINPISLEEKASRLFVLMNQKEKLGNANDEDIRSTFFSLPEDTKEVWMARYISLSEKL